MKKPRKSRNEPTITTIRLPAAVMNKANARADEMVISRNRYIVELIESDAEPKKRRKRVEPSGIFD